MYKIPDHNVVKRLDCWKKLRLQLEKSLTPLEDTSNFFSKFPKVKYYTDPYDRSTWPTPWELIEENQFCPFNTILAIAYTIQLCDRFKNIQPQITISIDNNNKTVYYLLLIGNKIYNYNLKEWVDKNQISKSLKHIKIYLLDPIN